MSQIKIYKDNYTDSTVVSNRFIDEYMKDANDAQLKVYLYLVRIMSANLSTSVSDIADKFNHTEKDVLRSLKYWEKNKLLSLDYDGNKALVGIHMANLNEVAGETEVALAPIVSIVPKAGAATETAPSKSIEAPFPAPAPLFEKPSFSLDQLKEFTNRQDTAQLLFIAESYLKKPLTSNEMKAILFFSETLHFSDDLIDYLIQYCIERGKKDFKYIEAVAINWAQAGITTPAQAEQFAYKYDKTIYTVMKALGKTSAPTVKESEFIKRWIHEYGFHTDIILEACERTVLATDKHRFEYAESILSSWKKKEVHHKSDIDKIDASYQKKRPASGSSQSTNKFNQYTQNEYDYEALEKELLSY